jgi:hypothetical protein
VHFKSSLIRDWIDTGKAPAELVGAGDLVISRNLPLTPVHPGSTDPTLAAVFTVLTPDEDVAQRLLTDLWSNAAVDAAYAKPPESLP